MQIVDQAFIERQYIETRESSQEANYFRQLMDIERSMENTTIALGFELKRTHAKYLQQAADFIREQMARLQTEVRAESRLSARSESRLSVVHHSLATSSPSLAANADHFPPPVPTLPPALAQETRLQLLPPVLPSPVDFTPAFAQLRQSQHRRVAGAEPTPHSQSATLDADSVDRAAAATDDDSGDASVSLTEGSDLSPFAATLPPSQQRSFTDLAQQRRSATMSSAFILQAHRGLGVFAAESGGRASSSSSSLSLSSRPFDSASRVSGLARIMGSATPLAPPTPSAQLPQQRAGSAQSVGSDVSEESLADLLLLASGSARPSHRSPLAAIASEFFSASQESMSTVALSDTVGSNSSALFDAQQHMLLHSSSATLVTPTKSSSRQNAAADSGGSATAMAAPRPIAMNSGVSNSMGYFSGHRKTHELLAREEDLATTPPSKPSTIHWPPRSEGRRPPSSRTSSIAIDTQDMTAEELLESLKLPPAASILGSSTPTRTTGSFASSTPGSGSLGRHSPRPRAGSYSDLCRSFPALTQTLQQPQRFSMLSESPSSDTTLPPLHHPGAFATTPRNSKPASYVFQTSKTPMTMSRGSVGTLAGEFDSRAEIKINLGLDKAPEHSHGAAQTLGHGTMTSGTRTNRTGKRMGPRRRSRSVGAWDRSVAK
ncbi:hypothetical protein H4R26_000346 [Coemansia thaxteri]|uniref:Uncharacterized protein n=1 Tax=Coemansia thaxteri TaxID=2663907 RepID=A0A9W8EKA7_9FUNG|nr:hypothetical protein H4R26_000346 [Coemansia thaxteri]KAJ2483594.1 hypothetical protein EV174_002913 [Coemansia sp. RSA 2320]